MTNEEYEQLISHRFFKPQQLLLNSDKYQSLDSDEQEISKGIRELVFKTAQLYKNELGKIEKEQLETLSQNLSSEDRDNVTKLMVKLYTLGLQNGAVSYANSLIQAIEGAC